MHSAPCVLYQFPDGLDRPRKPVVLATILPVEATQPRLQWQARVKGIDVARSCDVAGEAAFRKAGLYAWAAASDTVRLFVFDPNADSHGGYRYEAWVVQRYGDLSSTRHLAAPLVGNRFVCSRDAVEAMAACERDARAALVAAAGPLL